MLCCRKINITPKLAFMTNHPYNLEMLLKEHEKFDFSLFLQLQRRFRKLSRLKLCDETGLGNKTLFYLENGKFIVRPKEADIWVLADYYQIPFELLKKKLDDFISHGKNQRKYYTPKKAKK